MLSKACKQTSRLNFTLLFFLAWAIVFIAVFGMISPVFGLDHYETTRHLWKTNPTTCIMEPHPDLQTKFYAEHLKYTYDSILYWDWEMRTFTEGNWYLPMQLLLYEEHHYKDVRDYPQCNIFIEFDKANTGQHGIKDSALGWAAYDHSHSKHPYAYIMIYTHAPEETGKVSLCIGCDDQPEQSIEFSDDLKELPENAIKRIIRHEYGHALGLGHYIEDKDKNNNLKSLMYPVMNPFGENDIWIEKIDKIILRELYTADGFGGLEGYVPKYFQLHVSGQD